MGYYGRNCRNKCDHCKNSVTCGVQNGECDALGCINDGYQPPLCTGKIKCIIYFFQIQYQIYLNHSIRTCICNFY